MIVHLGVNCNVIGISHRNSYFCYNRKGSSFYGSVNLTEKQTVHLLKNQRRNFIISIDIPNE